MDAPDETKLQPFSLEAEESVLGGIILSNAKLDEIIDLVQPGFFYRGKNAKIFTAMLDCAEEQEPIDLVTLADRLKAMGVFDKIGGEVYLQYLAGRVPTAANIKYYAGIVHEKAKLRRIIEASTEIAQLGFAAGIESKDLIERLDVGLLSLQVDSSGISWVKLQEAVRDYYGYLKKMFEGGRELSGIQTGLHDLDRKIGGLRPGELIVIGARPKMGKTAIAMQLLLNAAKQAHPGIFFSLEMGQTSLTQRFICMQEGINSLDIQRALQDEWIDREALLARIETGADNLRELPIYSLDCGGISISEIKAKARMFRRKHPDGLGLVVIDYLQLIPIPGRTRPDLEVGAIVKQCKFLAKELAWPVVLLSQLNREVEKREDKRPMLADLKESGEIEAHADIVAMLYREEYYYPDRPGAQNRADLIIAANRNGPSGTVHLYFNTIATKFGNLEREVSHEDTRFGKD